MESDSYLTTSSSSVVIVVRHGERLDYVWRDRLGQNWIPTTDRPWDPPLTDYGHDQAQALGEALPEILEELGLSSKIAAVYSSPFLRCRQTSAGISAGAAVASSPSRNLGVKVELGLAESLNQNWYRSWAVPGTDGTWGFQKQEISLEELDVATLHPLSKQPVQGLLDWTKAKTDESTLWRMDKEHVSMSSLETPYSLHPPNFESFKMQRKRMKATMLQLSEQHPNETIVLVSHGGPVTHLYESLTGNKWQVHGVSRYCCYSIYQQKGEEDSWTPLVVNEDLATRHDKNKQPNLETKSSFAWS